MQDGNMMLPQVHFKMKKKTQLKKLMEAYCARQSLQMDQIRFLFDGNRLRDSQTPGELHMEDDDVIDVWFDAYTVRVCVKVNKRAICVINSEGYAREPCDDSPPWLTFKRGDRLHILKFLWWESPWKVDEEWRRWRRWEWHGLDAEVLETLPDWRWWRPHVSGVYVAALPDGTVGSVPPTAISFPDDADTKEEDDLSDISFSLPPTPDWQLKIDAFFFTPSESRRM